MSLLEIVASGDLGLLSEIEQIIMSSTFSFYFHLPVWDERIVDTTPDKQAAKQNMQNPIPNTKPNIVITTSKYLLEVENTMQIPLQCQHQSLLTSEMIHLKTEPVCASGLAGFSPVFAIEQLRHAIIGSMD